MYSLKKLDHGLIRGKLPLTIDDIHVGQDIIIYDHERGITIYRGKVVGPAESVSTPTAAGGNDIFHMLVLQCDAAAYEPGLVFDLFGAAYMGLEPYPTGVWIIDIRTYAYTPKG